MSKDAFGSASKRRKREAPNETRDMIEEAGQEETVRLNADIPKSLHTRLRVKALEEDKSMKDLLIGLIEGHLD